MADGGGKLSKIFRHLLFFLLLSVLFPPQSWAKDAIRWLTIDYPPIYFTYGENAGQGIADQALRLIMAKMPEYDHVIEMGTVSRATEAMKRGENVCIPTLFVTDERKQFGLFSTHPTTLLPPLAIIARKDGEDVLRAAEEPVSLNRVLSEGGLLLGIVANHSYGREVDQVIEAHQGKENLFLRSGIGATEGLLEMVLKHRIDFTIAYPWSLAAKLGTDSSARFRSISFIEAGKHPRHHVLCTGNEWGRQVIARVDKILKAELPTPGYRAMIERWLPPDSLPLFRQAYDEFLSAGAR